MVASQQSVPSCSFTGSAFFPRPFVSFGYLTFQLSLLKLGFPEGPNALASGDFSSNALGSLPERDGECGLLR